VSGNSCEFRVSKAFRLPPYRRNELKPTATLASTLGPLQPLSVTGNIRVVRRNPHGDIDGAVLEDGTLLHLPPHAGRQFAELLQEGRLLTATGFGTANEFGQTIAVAMLGPSTDALALVEPPPAKSKRHPEDRKVREEEA
jgi:hypothetical protein